MALRYDGRVAIVTGAGGGLGRAYALLLASRGCKVVVNDLGGSTSGEGASKKAADIVVDEIKKLGGEAIANYDSVEDGEKIAKTALDAWKRIDILINNAGILRDVSFMKMTEKDWDLIFKVHVKGAFSVTRACWNHMRDAGFGRIVMTTSAAGLYGNFGQANYSAAKLALVGFANSLSKEGAKRNVFVNTIAPLAGSRMTESVMPPDLWAAMKPDYVAPLVAWLVSETCTENGSVFEVGAGWVSQVRYQRSHGIFLDPKQIPKPEDMVSQWKKVSDFSSPQYPTNVNDSVTYVASHIARATSKL